MFMVVQEGTSAVTYTWSTSTEKSKSSLAGLGSNVTEEAVKWVGKSIGHSVKILRQFDHVNDIKERSGHHSRSSCERDLQIMLKQLHEVSKVFKKIPGRAHLNFLKLKRNATQQLLLHNLK